jgi:hypothetical protein
LLQIMEAAARIGVLFALPIQENLTNSSPIRSHDVEVDV